MEFFTKVSDINCKNGFMTFFSFLCKNFDRNASNAEKEKCKIFFFLFEKNLESCIKCFLWFSIYWIDICKTLCHKESFTQLKP